jgi:nucleoid-associated protein YgaU
MTLWDVAEEVYGDRRDWRRLWDANPQVNPNDRLAAGTRLALPSDARGGR